MGFFSSIKRFFGVTKRFGRQALASLLVPSGGIGAWTGAWTDSRIEQARHLTHWVYVASKRKQDKVAQQIPNVSLVVDGKHADPDRILNEKQRRKALTPIQTHEHLQPVSNDHPLLRLLRKPNEMDTAFDFLAETILYLDLMGNCYWWVVPNGLGLPAELYVIPAQWVWPVKGRDKIIEGYDIRPIEGNYERRYFPAEDVIHFRLKGAISKIDGYAATTAVSQWIDIEESLSRTRWFSFRNGAFPGVALEFDSKYLDPTEQQLREIEAKFMARYAGETRANKPLFLPPGVKMQKLQVTPAEMDYTASADQIRDMILAAFGVPAVIAGITKNMTYGSVRAAQVQFSEGTINPLLDFLGQVITEQLASRYDRRLRVWFNDTTPDDPTQRERELQTDLLAGAISPNELRALRGRPPYKQGGNNPLVNGGLVEAPYVEEARMLPTKSKPDAPKPRRRLLRNLLDGIGERNGTH